MPAHATKPREWSPRFWEGSDFFAWLRLMWVNRGAVEPRFWYIAAICSGMSWLNTILRWRQEGLYGSRIDAYRAKHPPLFVIGHWRTGTTLLHELLILDERFTSPSTIQCFMPCHFLLSADFYKKYLWFFVPDRRPMDNMAAGWDRPQEDEFALCLLGEPSTYTDVAFPNRPAINPGALDLSGLTERERTQWKRTLKRFVAALGVHDPRRLVLKSPPHTARIKTLLELYPDAKFVHIKRDPYVLFASTVNLWTSMAKKHGFQMPRNPAQIEEKVFQEFRTIYERLFETVPAIPAGQYAEIRYEDLVKDLVGGVDDIYAKLNLGEFDAVRPHIEEYAARSKGYETNKYTLTLEMREKITERWGDLIAKLGYA